MNSREFREAMKQLGLQFGSRKAANLLGICTAASKRYANGMPIPKEVADSLEQLVKKRPPLERF